MFTPSRSAASGATSRGMPRSRTCSGRPPACCDGLIQAIGIDYRLGRGGAGDHNVGCLQRVESFLERHRTAAKFGCQLGSTVGAAAGHRQITDAVAPVGRVRSSSPSRLRQSTTPTGLTVRQALI